MFGQFLLHNRYVVTARAAVARQSHDHQFGDVRERDHHDTAFGEMAIRGTAGRQTWVGGLAAERDAYVSRDVHRFDYAFVVPGAFGQYDYTITPAVSLSASGRLDFHSEYGTFFSPRVSVLARSGHWTSRGSLGTGFFASTPLTEETEAAGLSRLQIARPLKAERGVSASFDLTRTDGPFSYTATLFGARIRDPIYVARSPAYVVSNLVEPTMNVGVELLGTFRREPFAVTATYTYVHARDTVDGSVQDVPQTPRHSAGLVGMWEEAGAGRVGVEWYYTGRQSLEENPYRSVSEPYMVVGALAERQFGRVRLFINAENLSGVRQSKWDPLLRPTRAVDGRWAVDAWAPLEGRNVNGGIRLRF
jgi:iron complex outermembrane receptor protein